jgi:eukaryotic-like serine/threonine-protein kinase
MSLQPGARFGTYVIVRSLGHGGMGEVFEARDTRLDRRVAVKTLRPELLTDVQAQRRFEREAKALSALNHPNICTVFDIGRHDSLDYIVMEYIDGVTLSEMLDTRTVDESSLVRIGAQIAEALADAHEHGVLHRDIKPQNVIVTPRGHVKVLDFGLAKAIAGEASGDSATITAISDAGDVAGTAAYMSPEQVRGESLDGRSDVFSLGCLLYSAIVGRSPFEAKSRGETYSGILTAEPIALSRVAPATSAELQRIVRKCLEKDRTQRYQTVRDVAIDLQNLLRDSSTGDSGRTAVPSDQLPRLQSGTHSPRRVGAIVGATVAAVIVLTALAWWTLVDRPAVPDVRSVAILPFKPLAAANENYLGVGIADAVISRLSSASDITVRPTSAVRRYAGVETDAMTAGRELQVEVILDGTWQREADRLRVSVNLLRVANGASLWTDRFDLAATDLFRIQDLVSEQLASRLRLEVASLRRSTAGGAGGTNSPEAYDAYLRGRYHLGLRQYNSANRTELDMATRHLERAISIDPKYAEAHAKLGFAYAHRAIFMDNDAALIERARAETNAAEALRQELAQVHLNRAFMLWSWYEGWRLVDSIREYRRAEQLDPGLSDVELGAGYAHLGLRDDWRRVQERAIERDPTNRQAREVYVNEYFLLNLPEEGLAAQKRLLNEGPDERYYLLTRRVADAAPLVEAQADTGSSDPVAQTNLALLRALQGRHRDAQELVARALAVATKNRGYHHLTYHIARVYALQGNAGEAARWLRETIDWGFPCYPMFSTDRFLEPVRQAPEVRKILDDLKTSWDGYRDALR